MREPSWAEWAQKMSVWEVRKNMEVGSGKLQEDTTQNHEKWRFYTPKKWVITPKNEVWWSLWVPYIYIYIYTYSFCFADSSWRSASKVLYRRPKRDPTECGDGPAICLADTCEGYDTGPSVGYLVCSMCSRVQHAYKMTSWNDMQLSRDHRLIGIYSLGNKIALETLETVIL